MIRENGCCNGPTVRVNSNMRNPNDRAGGPEPDGGWAMIPGPTLYCKRLRMAHSFNRLGNAPRFVFQISNSKSQIEQSRPAGHAVTRVNANRVRYNRFGPGYSRRSETATLWLGSERLRQDDSEEMPESYSHQPDPAQDNRFLHNVIRDTRKSVDAAARELHKMLEDHETFLAETPIEVWTAMELAAEGLTDALRSLNQVKSKDDTPTAGGPTRQQGQFLAYIHEYIKSNHRGVAPTLAALQRFFNLTAPSVNSMLKRLDEKGYIRRIPGKTRAIELTIALELIPPLDRPFRL